MRVLKSWGKDYFAPCNELDLHKWSIRLHRPFSPTRFQWPENYNQRCGGLFQFKKYIYSPICSPASAEHEVMLIEHVLHSVGGSVHSVGRQTKKVNQVGYLVSLGLLGSTAGEPLQLVKVRGFWGGCELERGIGSWQAWLPPGFSPSCPSPLPHLAYPWSSLAQIYLLQSTSVIPHCQHEAYWFSCQC